MELISWFALACLYPQREISDEEPYVHTRQFGWQTCNTHVTGSAAVTSVICVFQVWNVSTSLSHETCNAMRGTQADQRDPGDYEENTCLRSEVGIPQGNFRAIYDDFNEGKLLRISSEALVMTATGDASETGFLVRDTDFWVSQAQDDRAGLNG